MEERYFLMNKLGNEWVAVGNVHGYTSLDEVKDFAVMYVNAADMRYNVTILRAVPFATYNNVSKNFTSIVPTKESLITDDNTLSLDDDIFKDLREKYDGKEDNTKTTSSSNNNVNDDLDDLLKSLIQ